ncbi:MAG TPA: sialidase family protein [Candidatus Deferrimicrobium sp.]|nr:sialidase family protein [Candidatus Deferrimicrobium sp.]
MIGAQEDSEKISKKYLIASIIQVFSAMLLAGILWLLNMFFGGEFVIIAENVWIFIIFGVIIVGSTIYNMIIIIFSIKSGRWRGKRSKKLDQNTAWQVGWSIWNIIVGILLIIIFGVVYTLIADFLKTAGLTILVLVFAIPFIGFGGLFIYSSLIVFYRKIKKLKNAKILPGLTVAGISFLFLISSFGLILLFYNPNWTQGVEHQALFTSGEEPGRGYRIPALLVLSGDIILAFCESRADPMLDWGDIDLVMKRSIDGGDIWSNITVLIDAGTHTAGNPCPVYDNATGTVWLPYCVDNKKVYIINSTDLGVTWSESREITAELDLNLSGSMDPLVLEYGTGPGCGIQLSNGRLIIPSYYFDERGSHVLYSDDHGVTWQKGVDLNCGSECQAFESVNGSLCLNARPTSSEKYRVIAWSHDDGSTWASYYIDYELPDPACMASITRFTDNTTHQRNRILFSNPNRFSRGHLTLRMSYDEGASWNVSKLVYEGPSAYSQIAILSDYTICILFEQGHFDYRENLQFIRVTLDWLTDGMDYLVPK